VMYFMVSVPRRLKYMQEVYVRDEHRKG
jgi:hypothetical protein